VLREETSETFLGPYFFLMTAPDAAYGKNKKKPARGDRENPE